MNKIRVQNLPVEALIWLTGLIILACSDPHENHFTLCPLGHFGWTFCPGCGLGKSISFLFHGSLIKSWHAHPLGIFALVVLTLRIYKLLKPYAYGQNY